MGLFGRHRFEYLDDEDNLDLAIVIAKRTPQWILDDETEGGDSVSRLTAEELVKRAEEDDDLAAKMKRESTRRAALGVLALDGPVAEELPPWPDLPVDLLRPEGKEKLEEVIAERCFILSLLPPLVIVKVSNEISLRYWLPDAKKKPSDTPPSSPATSSTDGSESSTA